MGYVSAIVNTTQGGPLRSAIRVLFVVTAITVSLTGCTSAVTTPTSIAHSNAPTHTSSVSTPFTCRDVASASDLAEIDSGLVLRPVDEYTVVPPSADPWSASRVSLSQGVNPASSPSVLAAFRAGFLACKWSNDANHAVLTISALPNGVDAYEQQATIDADADVAHYGSLEVGTKSSAGCTPTGDAGPSCRIDALVGTTWFAVMAANTAANSASDTVRTALAHIADKFSAAIVAAGALVSARAPSEGHWDGMADCMAISSAVESVTQDKETLSTGSLDVTGAFDPMVRAAIDSAHGFSCKGDGQSSRIRVSVTPGADWLGPLNYSDGTAVQSRFSTSEALVAPRALCTTSDPDTCWAEGYIDHAFVVVAGLGSASQSADVLSALVTAIG